MTSVIPTTQGEEQKTALPRPQLPWKDINSLIQEWFTGLSKEDAQLQKPAKIQAPPRTVLPRNQIYNPECGLPHGEARQWLTSTKVNKSIRYVVSTFHIPSMFFLDHFPGRPLLPGTEYPELYAQNTAALLFAFYGDQKINPILWEARFKPHAPLFPDDQNLWVVTTCLQSVNGEGKYKKTARKTGISVAGKGDKICSSGWITGTLFEIEKEGGNGNGNRPRPLKL